MTTTTAEPTITTPCPAWCIDGNCRGEHTGYVAHTVPATGGLPSPSRYNGFVFPGIRVSLSHDTIDNLQPCVSIHLGSEEEDAQADLHAHEARQLIETLTLALDVLEGRASLVVPDEPRLAAVASYRGDPT